MRCCDGGLSGCVGVGVCLFGVVGWWVCGCWCELGDGGCCVRAVGGGVSVVGSWLSGVGGGLSACGGGLGAVGSRLSAVRSRFSAVGNRLSAVGSRFSAGGSRLGVVVGLARSLGDRRTVSVIYTVASLSGSLVFGSVVCDVSSILS